MIYSLGDKQLNRDNLDFWVAPNAAIIGNVTLKKNVLDPQGKVVENTLKSKGMNNLKNIRQGKYFEIEVEEQDENKATQTINQMCEKLLVNLIIEDYKISKL